MQTIETKLSESLVRITTKTPPTRIDDRLQTGTASTMTFDVAVLEKNLRAGVKGEVRFSDGSRHVCLGCWKLSDGSDWRHPPKGCR